MHAIMSDVEHIMGGSLTCDHWRIQVRSRRK